MSQQIINVGTAPNDGLGTPIRTAFQYTNNNFTQLFSLPNPNPPDTLVGKAGDVPGMYAYNSTYFYSKEIAHIEEKDFNSLIKILKGKESPFSFDEIEKLNLGMQYRIATLL